MAFRGFKVSVLFNEPKLLKSTSNATLAYPNPSFSALQRAEIAEIWAADVSDYAIVPFQCSSTSRNC